MIITLYREDCKTKTQNYKKVHRMPKHTVVTPDQQGDYTLSKTVKPALKRIVPSSASFISANEETGSSITVPFIFVS